MSTEQKIRLALLAFSVALPLLAVVATHFGVSISPLDDIGGNTHH